ncbi:MAG: VOC family protein [Bacteroidota bacterium]
MNLSVSDIKVFVPCKDYQVSLAFYQALGWELKADHGQLAEMELGGQRFFLQDYFQKDWAHNFMIYLNVADAQAWYEQATKVIAKNEFAAAKVIAPQKQAHGHIVCFVHDPSGVLLHFGQAIE